MILICCFLLLGCRATPPDPFAALTSNFSAELDGAMGETSFCVAITVENCDGGRLCKLVYSAPKSLDGVEIELLCDESGAAIGSASVKAPDGTLYTVSAASIKGFCLPLRSLLDTGEIASVQKIGSDYLFATADGAERTVSAAGAPISYSSASIRWSVRWFQSV